MNCQEANWACGLLLPPAAKPRRRRDGFTLVELIVVMALILLLAAIGVMFIPTFQEQQRAARGGVLLQGWLAIAKQQARRDQGARGIRLFPSSGNASHVRDLAYTEAPPDFPETAVAKASLSSAAGDPPKKTIRFDPINLGDPNVDFTGGQTDEKLYHVQKGDYLELADQGIVRRITDFNFTNPAEPKLIVEGDIDLPISNAPNWRVMRGPRVVGDPLQLPDGVVIDLTTNDATIGFNNPLPSDPQTGYIDILFSPSGKLIGRGTTVDMLVLWVRDATNDTGTVAVDRIQGEPSLITVRTASGVVAAYPPDQSNNYSDPYAFARAGKVGGP
jgi:prepilin-type N-terminal cleavage/methylation domain-containing protein